MVNTSKFHKCHTFDYGDSALALSFLVVTKGAMVSYTPQRHHQIKIDQLLRGSITSKRSQKCLPSNLTECRLQIAMKCFYNTFLVGVMRFRGLALRQPSVRANDTTLKHRLQKPLAWDHQKAFKDTPMCISGLVRMQISEHLKRTAYPPKHVSLRLSVIIGFLPDIVRGKKIEIVVSETSGVTVFYVSKH